MLNHSSQCLFNGWTTSRLARLGRAVLSAKNSRLVKNWDQLPPAAVHTVGGLHRLNPDLLVILLSLRVDVSQSRCSLSSTSTVYMSGYGL
jgi:hypothetical protein